MALFQKVLIANRGEIARRVIRTCKRLGIETVSIYSDADQFAPYVKEATESVHIGESPARKSYLDMEKVIDAAKKTGADAIHPGYGFLAENPEFVSRCEEEGIVFIGPKADVIRLMGSKLEARKQMGEAGVPIVPGSAKISSLEEALKEAESIGYPLMVKASAGGGGIGMKLVHNEEELKKAYEMTIKQAGSFFGDETLFLEKYIANPRHIEVQVARDRYGNSVHLFERECSVQRRHQKVIEESPSPFLDEKTRQRLFSAALSGADKLGYTNVGTMEFIFDENKNFYFLEMNTRLQVEHPVTEEITGLDLVEWQLRIAAGEELPGRQEEIGQSGHAIEVRLYAEDPNTFFPSPGKITKLSLPEWKARLEIGVEEGADVTPFYDPMIGKIIVHQSSRDKAIEGMLDALKDTEIEGIKTNVPLLMQVMENADFRSGNYTTNFLQDLFAAAKGK